MSKPSFSNIDLWLFELAEGNLNEQQVEDLKIFLLQHPELDVEKDVWEMAKVAPSKSVYPDTALLEKKEPKRLYYATGSIAILLLLFVGCYQLYETYDSQEKNKVVAANDTNSENSLSNNTSLNGSVVGSQQITNGVHVEGSRIAGDAFISSEQAFLLSPSVQSLISRSLTPTSVFGEDVYMGDAGFDHLTINDIKLVNHKIQTLRRKEFEKMSLYPVQTIEENATHTTLRTARRSDNISTRSYSSEYKESFKSKMKKALFNLERMFDNPVALKNYRDPHYHVPGKTANEINFSATGTMLRTRVQTLSRMQWYGEQNEQLMNVVSVDGYSYGIRGGLGLQLKNSIYNKGGLKSYEAAFTYSPKLSINHNISVEPSVRFKMGMKSLQQNKMQDVQSVELDRGNAIDYYGSNQTPTGSNLWYKDLGLGLMVNTKWFFAGVQVDNLFNHKDNMYGGDLNDPRRAGKEFIATAGVDWESRKENMMLSPYVIYMNKENISDVWLGVNYRYNWFTLGAAVSDKLEPAASIGMKFDRFSLIYNADYLTSAISGKQMLSHQISVRIMSKPNRYGRKLLNL